MRHIKTVETLCERADRLGVAINRKRKRYDDYGGMYYTRNEMDLIEVYRVESNDGIVKLYHYETLTCEINRNTLSVDYVYGESISDANSIYTFINYYLNLEPMIGYKPVNGGLYIRTPETITRGGDVDTWIDVYYDDNPTQFLSCVNFSYSF